MASTTKQSRAPRTKSARADENFYYQLKAGGERGWNDLFVDPKDADAGIDRFYLKFHGAVIASIHLVDDKGDSHTKITIFGAQDKCPVPSERDFSKAEWNQLFKDVMEAIQKLYEV